MRSLVSILPLVVLLRVDPRAPSRAPRWNAARRSPIPSRCANSITAGSVSRISWRRQRSADTPLTDSELFALPSMAPVRQAIDAEFDRYIAAHKAELPDQTIGVGDSFDFPAVRPRPALFRRCALCAVGHRQPDGPRLCRARHLRRDPADLSPDPDRRARRPADSLASPRLPMTLNVVLKAKGDAMRRSLTCAEIARRWLATADLPLDGRGAGGKAASRQTGRSTSIEPTDVDRIETNIQIAHVHEIADAGFPYRLSAESVRLQRADQGVRGSAAGEPDRSRADHGG